MERLTERTALGICGNNERVEHYPLYNIENDEYMAFGLINQCFEKLAEYEQAEEDGVLIRLQVRNGDYVYNNGYGFPCSYKIIGYYCDIEEIVYYSKNSDGSAAGSFPSSEIGKNFFLTFEEAEQALAKMEGE